MGSFVVIRGKECIEVTTNVFQPNVFHIELNAMVVLVQIGPDHYEVRKGRWRIGDITYCNGIGTAHSPNARGWRFVTRTRRFQSSRRLHRQPEHALAGRGLRIMKVFALGDRDAIA